MKAQELYEKLDRDFIKEGISDYNWAARMPELAGYLHDGFKQSGMGLMLDFAEVIEKVYTTVFLSDKVLEYVLAEGLSNAMIFSHHPTNWDIEGHGGNYAATEAYIRQLKERNIAVYVLHHPLDNFGPYATCRTLAEAIGLQIQKPGFLYGGALCGVFGTVACNTIGDLRKQFARAVGHEVSLYAYGHSDDGHSDEKADISGQTIAVVPGGGNEPFVLEEVIREGVTILLTGTTLLNDHSAESHKMEQEKGITLLGGTHYSTEKFAPMAMCGYFGDLGLPAEFVEDEPKMYDI